MSFFPNFSFSVSAPCPDKSGYVELLFNNLKTVVHCCQFYTMVVRAKFDISSFWLLFNGVFFCRLLWVRPGNHGSSNRQPLGISHELKVLINPNQPSNLCKTVKKQYPKL